VDAMAEALTAAARWVGCVDVLVEEVTPLDLRDPLRTAVAARSLPVAATSPAD
jgi:hypothetical protein